MAIKCARNYRKAMRTFAEMNPLDLWYRRYDAEEFFEGISDPDLREHVRRRVEKIAKKRGSDIVYPKLTHVVAGQTAIKDVPPTIFHPEHSLAYRRFAPTQSRFSRAIATRFPTNAGCSSTVTISLTPPSKS